MNTKLLAAACGILTTTAQSVSPCWWDVSVLYQPGQPGYTPGFWAFACQTPAQARVEAGFSSYYTNHVMTKTWYVTTSGQTVIVDPGTMHVGTNFIASLSVNLCGSGVKSIHAIIQGYPIGYNQAHAVFSDSAN